MRRGYRTYRTYLAFLTALIVASSAHSAEPIQVADLANLDPAHTEWGSPSNRAQFGRGLYFGLKWAM